MIKHFLKIKKLLNGSVNRPQTKKRTTTVENTQVFKDFLILARSEMDKNNLFDWNLELDFAKVRAGACHFNEKKIDEKILNEIRKTEALSALRKEISEVNHITPDTNEVIVREVTTENQNTETINVFGEYEEEVI